MRYNRQLMEVPRYWRTNKQRLNMMWFKCPFCGALSRERNKVCECMIKSDNKTDSGFCGQSNQEQKK